MFRNKGKKFDIQVGEVVSVKKDKVKVCEGGKLVNKDKSEVPTPYKIGCNGEYVVCCMIVININAHYARLYLVWEGCL